MGWGEVGGMGCDGIGRKGMGEKGCSWVRVVGLERGKEMVENVLSSKKSF